MSGYSCIWAGIPAVMGLLLVGTEALLARQDWRPKDADSIRVLVMILQSLLLGFQLGAAFVFATMESP